MNEFTKEINYVKSACNHDENGRLHITAAIECDDGIGIGTCTFDEKFKVEESCFIPAVTHSKERAEEIVNTINENCVFPCHIAEVLEDML